MSEPELRNIPELSSADESLWELVGEYKKFSSVEESFKWLQSHKFEKYSFHFGRFNIPFFALPYVNFFIVNEMGGTIDDQKLLDALHALKQSPTYNAKAVTFWLRDLELETYSNVFAENLFLSLEEFSAKGDYLLSTLVSDPEDSERLQTGIKEMKEFQFYYSATSSMLCELGLEKYSEMFVQHGISIDLLPLMTEKQLAEIGVSNARDRKRIISAIQKITAILPRNQSSNSSPPPPKRTNNNQKSNFNETTTKNSSDVSDKSVDDWLEFINGKQNNGSRKTSKKKRKRRKSTKKSPQTSFSKIESLEEEIVEHLPKKKSVVAAVVEENNHNQELEEESNCSFSRQPKGKLETLNICSPILQGEEITMDEIDNFELLDSFDAEVEEFRKRLAAASVEPSRSSIFTSID